MALTGGHSIYEMDAPTSPSARLDPPNSNSTEIRVLGLKKFGFQFVPVSAKTPGFRDCIYKLLYVVLIFVCVISCVNFVNIFYVFLQLSKCLSVWLKLYLSDPVCQLTPL